jgi:hypothetical protein
MSAPACHSSNSGECQCSDKTLKSPAHDSLRLWASLFCATSLSASAASKREEVTEKAKKSLLPDPVTLAILGATLEERGGDHAADSGKLHIALTLSLANALGRKGEDKTMFTDSTTQGASGSPVFDAHDGQWVAIIHCGLAIQHPSEIAFPIRAALL